MFSYCFTAILAILPALILTFPQVGTRPSLLTLSSTKSGSNINEAGSTQAQNSYMNGGQNAFGSGSSSNYGAVGSTNYGASGYGVGGQGITAPQENPPMGYAPSIQQQPSYGQTFGNTYGAVGGNQQASNYGQGSYLNSGQGSTATQDQLTANNYYQQKQLSVLGR